MKKIILVGYMGSGKTTVGKKLGVELAIPFIDLDHFIEDKEQLTINEIFKQKGEVYFRKAEQFWFNELLNTNEQFVLSLGGGTPCYANNHLKLQDDRVQSFYLKTNVSTLVERLKNSNRPLLQNIDDLTTYIAQHLFERNYFYNFSKHILPTNNKDITAICHEILSIIKKND
ncbi:shikimate kinase [Flavobacterium sp. CBA20B-1]|uniref:shikimate kinase n=1 Tax=unclassified Flavobacterium TaxID=196869 RepID=UPI0022245906|nr:MULTISPECIES: shikimate kinase [unclassified Flavobacterium]WCM41889.1 shikimate kinase [Flavobacterium sp. CBA20B-1]